MHKVTGRTEWNSCAFVHAAQRRPKNAAPLSVRTIVADVVITAKTNTHMSHIYVGVDIRTQRTAEATHSTLWHSNWTSCQCTLIRNDRTSWEQLLLTFSLRWNKQMCQEKQDNSADILCLHVENATVYSECNRFACIDMHASEYAYVG